MQRRLIWVTLLSIAIVVTVLYQSRKVHATSIHDHHRVCSVASLNGRYAFRRTGVNNDIGGPIAQIGIDVFNGDGTRGPIRSTISNNGVIVDWCAFPTPTGSYTVDRDCTGSILGADGAKTNNLIVLDGGNRFILLSVSPDTITTEEGQRLEPED